MKYFLITLFIFFSISSGITPPNKGKFPAKMIKFLKENPDYIKYGNAGWIKKMNDIKNNKSLAKTSIQASFNLPVLLGSFNDSTGIIPLNSFAELLFGENLNGSMIDYYNEISYNQFALDGDVYGWYTADQGFAHYTGDNNGYGAYPASVAGFVVNIVGKADTEVDFGQYDNDGPDGEPNSGDDDGYADAVCIVYAGAGAEWFPGNDSFWPHASGLGSNAFTTNDASASGGNIIVDTYFVCPEEAGGGSGNGTIRQIGVFAHEFGHILGLPDLYDRTDSDEGPDFEDSEGIGEWCLMASGSWGGDGAHDATPAHMSAWCKYKLGWIEPNVVTNQATLTINQAENDPEAFYLIWEDPYALNSYFLIENRQKVGFDQYLNGDGLLIFHIDEHKDVSWTGFQNDDETHKLVDLEEADGLANMDNSQGRGDAGDTYPGTSNNLSFTDETSPSARDYDNQPTGIAITNISASGSIMTADVTPRELTGYSILYDEGGLAGWGWGYAEAADSWGGVLFDSDNAGVLTGVDIGIKTAGTNYEISVYSSFSTQTLQPGPLLTVKTGTASNIGWHTINFDEDVNISTEQSFFVSLKITGQTYAIPFDPSGPIDQRSYFSGNGTSYSATIQNSGDFNIRARILDNPVTGLNESPSINKSFTLAQNYPNPFNPKTIIKYSLSSNDYVTLKIFDIAGREVSTLVKGNKEQGVHFAVFDGSDLASGLYIYKIEAGNFEATKKMMLIK